MCSPLSTQPSVLMNRFIVNLKSLNTSSSSQGSSDRHHWSRFSTPNFHIPDSFLGNIGEDLQDGHEPPDYDHGSNQVKGTLCLNTEGPPEAELEETSTTLGSCTSRPMDTQVSLSKFTQSRREMREHRFTQAGPLDSLSDSGRRPDDTIVSLSISVAGHIH